MLKCQTAQVGEIGTIDSGTNASGQISSGQNASYICIWDKMPVNVKKDKIPADKMPVDKIQADEINH